EDLPQPAELPGRDRSRRQVQVTADHLGDVADRHALVAHRVEPGPRRGLFRRQAEQVRGVQYVHRGPAAGPVAGVAGDARVAGDGDQAGDEAVPIAVTVHRSG